MMHSCILSACPPGTVEGACKPGSIQVTVKVQTVSPIHLNDVLTSNPSWDH